MDIGNLAVEAGTSLKRIIEMMRVGIAFPETTKTYRIFNHEGDDMGQVSTADIESAIRFAKRHGIEVGKSFSSQLGGILPAFTFSWSGWRY